ncbi:MAG: hypothetical protein ACFCVA_14875 [Gammaproteobacteria bacterium]
MAGPVAVVGVLIASPAAWAFSFSEEQAKAEGKARAESEQVQQLVSVPCQETVKNKKIMLLIAERTGDGWVTTQSRYGPHFDAINRRLRALGLRTHTQEEIRAQIAQAEIEAYFHNDPDAALVASRRFGASFILRGTITTHTGVNPVLGIPEVAVHMGFTLSSAAGRTLSDVSARGESFSGADTLGAALTLVAEQADRIVAQLYNDYCRSAGAIH